MYLVQSIVLKNIVQVLIRGVDIKDGIKTMKIVMVLRNKIDFHWDY
jgi:hypothetical protein